MDIDSVYQRGYDLRCEGKYSQARVEFEKILAIDPKHCEARWQLGLIQGFEGDFDGSLVTLRTLAQENPTKVNVRNDLAMTMMMLGYIDEAGAEFREILRLDPEHENAKKQIIYF
jgi:tetratricopeptide (TPR) repeat protein